MKQRKSLVLDEWLRNPYWREYYETAPSDLCREYIALEFWHSEYEDEEIALVMDEIEAELDVTDLRHLMRYAGNDPRKGILARKIREREMSPDR